MTRAYSKSQPSIWERQQDWPFEPSGYYFLARAAHVLFPDVAEDLQKAAGSRMRRKLADGEFPAVALMSDGRLAPVRSSAWVFEENFNKWFSSCQITNFDLFGSGVHPLAGMTHFWLFVEKASVDAIFSPEIEKPPAKGGAKQDAHGIPDPRKMSVRDIGQTPFLFLGQVVEWIICRGRSSDSVDMDQQWDAAERELFDYLDTESVKVEGYPIDGRPRIYESLPAGIWAKMNRDDNSGLMFSPIDDTEEREDGGTVCVGKLQWDGVRLPTNVVLKRWPPADLSPEQPKTVGRRPRYDWAAFREVALAKLDEEGAFDPSVDTQWNKAALERHMAAWCRGNWGVEPSESTIRSKLTEIEAAYLEGRKGR
jgi:hypothetical protein